MPSLSAASLARPGLPPAAPLRDAFLRRLRAAGPGLALRVGGMSGGLRDVLVLRLLEDAAVRGGGEVVRPADGSLLLIGAKPGLVGPLAEQIDAIGELPPVRVLVLPDAIEQVLGWMVPASAPAQAVAIDPAALDALLAATPPAGLIRRRPVVRLGAAAPRRVAELVTMCRAALARALGDLAADPDLAAHAAEWLAAAMLADPAMAGADPGLPAILPLPGHGTPPGPGNGAQVGLVPAAAAADRAALAARRAALGGQGWGLAIGPLDAATLRLVDVTALAADLLLLRWSPALAEPALAVGLRAIDPRLLVLGGCDGPAAIGWGQGVGIVRFAGPAVPVAACG